MQNTTKTADQARKTSQNTQKSSQNNKTMDNLLLDDEFDAVDLDTVLHCYVALGEITVQ